MMSGSVMPFTLSFLDRNLFLDSNLFVDGNYAESRLRQGCLVI